ncbi:MAG: PilT/PilU family type 4a pilus ATPase, partial [Myxococcota bacterium]
MGGVSAGSQGGRVDSIAIGREASPAPAARRAETLEIGRLAGGSRAEELEIGRPAAASSGSAQPRPSHSERPAPAASAPAAPVSSAPAASPRPVQDVGPAPGPKQVDPFLREAVGLGASDIHFHAGSPVRRRVNGALADAGADVLSPERSREMVLELLSSRERHALEQNGQIDFAYAIDGLARFRCNAYRQQNGHDLIMRAIAAEPPSLEQLNLPGNLAKFTNYHQGMVLVTGPAGCGKSSTMAALINIINEERLDHIITVEDPIEFVHVNKRCVINQRQVGPHTKSFARALKGALREDPDIIALGELRDLETISLALTAAETGHLVIATLHTGNSIRTVNRLIGVFPP